MSSEQDLIKKIQQGFPSGIEEIQEGKEHRIEITCTADSVVDFANYIKHDLGFSIPNMCTGIDMKDNMRVVWHVGTPDSPIILVINVFTDREESNVPSLTPVWEGMNWHERETFDLLGVNFLNHPDLRRLLLPEEWEGHPLREDYVYKKPTYRKPEDFK